MMRRFPSPSLFVLSDKVRFLDRLATMDGCELSPERTDRHLNQSDIGHMDLRYKVRAPALLIYRYRSVAINSAVGQVTLVRCFPWGQGGARSLLGARRPCV